MKGFKMLVEMFLAVALLSMSVGAGQWNSQINSVVAGTGSAALVSCAKTSGGSVAIVANSSRIDGYVTNVSTNYLQCNYVSTGTISTSYFYIYPAGDSYAREHAKK